MEESFKKIEHAKVGSQPIAVIGLGCRLPGGIDSPEKFWQLLVEEREAITEVPLDRWQLDRHFDADRTKPLAQYVRRGGFIEGIDQFDPALFGITSREAICLDPQQRLLLEASWRALEDGGQPLDQLRGESIGVFMGISSSDYISLLWASEQDYLFPDNEPFVLAGNTGCIAANRISYVFDFKGPSFTVDTACSSSLVAVHLACESLRRGECRAALAGGAQVLLQPGVQMSFCKAGLLSPEGRCKSFDAAADGYVRSEGAGVVLLKPLEDALRDGDPVQAVIRGSAVNSDGRSNGLSAPNRRAQIACMRDAYAKAGVNPSSVLYVEAHGTGTRLGDPVELLAIGSVMGAGRPSHFPCRVGSVKSNLGHSETAAGITGLIKAVLCLRQRKIPATLHCRTPNPAVDFQKLGLQVQTSLEVFPDGIQSAVLGVSSFGFGGTNAHVVLQEAVSTIGSHPAVTPLEDEPPIQLLCLSAQSLEALRLLASAYAALIRRQPQMSLNDICATTHLERGCFRYRLVLVAADRQELLSQLEGPSDPICCGEVCEKTYNRPLPKELAQIQLGLRGISGRRQLQALAQAIGAGHNCDWSYFHAPYPHRPCSVPGHPFVRQRYWWNKSGEERKNGRLWRHQLGFVGVQRQTSGVLRVLDLPGPLRHFEVELSSSEPSDLGQHCVRQVSIFPATGYLQLAIEAEHLRGRGESPFVLSNFNIEKSLSLSSDSVCMQLVSDGEQLTFFAQTESGGAWQRLAKLRVGASPLDSKFIAPGEVIQADIGMNSVMQMSNEELIAIQVNAFYGALSNAGFQYGSHYRPVRNLRAGAGEAWAQLERPVAAPDRCMLDGCLQSVAAALSPNLQPEKLFVPVGIEKIIFKQWPLPDRFICTCRLRPQRGAELPLEADITLQTLDDRFLGRLEGIKLRSLNQKNPDCYITRWSSFVVTGSVADHFDRHPLRPWLLQQQHLAELVFWPQLDHLTVEEACDQLLVRLRAKPSTLWLVLEGNGPSSSALDALMRSAAAELPLCRCTVLQVPRALEAQPKASDWSALQAAAEQHGLLRWCDGEIQIPHLEPLIPTRFRIATDGSGRIEGLRPVALPQRTLEPGEVELEVEATGLNFRDVLNSLGLLNHHLAEFGLSDPTQLPFGGECIGRVVGIGPGVDASLIGQQLIATLTVGSLASHVVAKVAFCTPLPNGMAVSDAAGVSTAFLTAIYGLEHLAQLQAGESVLIHAAAGGVGQAALQVALRRGARVFATASTAKQQALLEQGVEAVFDSRTLTFADQILQCTNGRGVDVVLNSFKGDWVDASFRALAQGGRFVELGKIDVWTHDQVRRLRPDAQYLPFDLLEVAERQPVLITQLLNQLIADFNKDFLKPLPTTVMSMECAQAAVRLMAQGKHVGKVVLTRPQPIHIRSDATYVVTGALGGIGRQLLPWLVERGARSLLLIGRSIDQLDSSAQSLLSQLHEAGATCLLLACDLGVGQKDLLIESFNALPADQPVRGIFHMAGVLADGPLDNLNSERLRTVVQPKLHGLLELEQACQRSASNALQFVVSFSSIAALFGSPGQVAYSAANGAMQGLCHEDATSIRRLAIQWGPWAGEGMAAGLEKSFASRGIGMLNPATALSLLGDLLERGQSGVVAVIDNNWKRLQEQSTPRQRHWFTSLTAERPETYTDAPQLAREATRELLLPFTQEERLEKLIVLLEQHLGRLLECESFSQVDRLRSLFELGLDSLMAVEFTASVQAELGLEFDMRVFNDEPSLYLLAEQGLVQLFADDSSGPGDCLDLALEAQLSEGWLRPQTPPARSPGESVLLTGATGYLGAYLLAGQLQRWPDLEIRCLVRAPTEQAGLERIYSNLQHYNLWQPSWEKRLVVTLGDLSERRFGLDASGFRSLARGLGGILHNGAQLSQLATYSQLAATNVSGTREVLELATCDQPLRIELISSVAVFEATAYRNCVVLETDSLQHWQGIYLGYSQTKWVSEQLVLAAAAEGLPVVVYRPPLIGGHSRTGQWHEGDLLQRLLQGAMALGMAPDIDWELDAVPVDYVADAVTALAWTDVAEGRCFHLQHPQPVMLSTLVQRLRVEGAPLQLVPMSQWLAAIAAQPSNALHPLLALFEQRWGRDQLTYPELNCVGFRARPSTALTTAVLDGFGVHCPSFDQLVVPWAQSLLFGNPKTR